jgi:hypothetical protein
MRPPYNPSPTTKRQVTLLASFGLSDKQIANVLALDHRTLRRHCASEIQSGREQAATVRLTATLQQVAKNAGAPAQRSARRPILSGAPNGSPRAPKRQADG